MFIGQYVNTHLRVLGTWENVSKYQGTWEASYKYCTNANIVLCLLTSTWYHWRRCWVVLVTSSYIPGTAKCGMYYQVLIIRRKHHIYQWRLRLNCPANIAISCWKISRLDSRCWQPIFHLAWESKIGRVNLSISIFWIPPKQNLTISPGTLIKRVPTLYTPQKPVGKYTPP